MSTYLTNQNAVLSAPGLTGAAVTYPKTIPQLTAVVAPYGRDTRQERGHRPAGHRHLRGATLAARGVAWRAREPRPRTRTCMESSVWSDWV